MRTQPQTVALRVIGNAAQVALHHVQIDQQGGRCQAERQHRHQALAARQHAAVLRCDFAQNFQRFVERARRVADERRWLHAAEGPALQG